jgi:hypothetical protein
MGSVSRRCNTYEAVTKKGGKTTLTAHIVVAADGKTRITTQTGKDGQGQTVNNKIFYEKQRRRASIALGTRSMCHGGGVLRRVTDLAGQIRGMESRICQDIRISDLAGGSAEFCGSGILLSRERNEQQK